MSIRLMPPAPGEEISDLYEVTVNGQPLPLHCCWVSAVPFNRRWPGHQRQKEQREAAAFALLAADEPLHFVIRPKRPFEAVTVRPLSLGIQPQVTDGAIAFTLEKPAFCTVEPDGMHGALHLFADPLPDYDVDPADPAVLYYGSGLHEADCIELHSGQTLFLDAGATVYGTVHAQDAENIRILGRGILDASHNVEKILYEANKTTGKALDNAVRTHTIQLDHCRNIEIDGITIRDSLVYNIRPIGCHDMTIRHVKTIGNWRYNSDGFDMHNCCSVQISDCFLRCYDDCICAKGWDRQTEMRPDSDHFDGLTVERCVLWNDWGRGLEIGAETRGREMCNILWKDCDIIHGAHIFLDVQNVDDADIHDITFDNIRCECDGPIPVPALQWSDDEVYDPHYEQGYLPTLFTSIVYRHDEYSQTDERGHNRRITLHNIFVTGPAVPPMCIEGFDAEHPSEDITIDGIYLNGVRQLPESLVPQTNEFVRDLRIL